MDAFTNLLTQTITQVWITFTHNWPFLVISTLIAALLKLYLDPQKVSAYLVRHQKAGVIGATAAAVATPLCSCGTTAVILGMMASMMPWAPIVAFMVASPLTSPEELVYSAGLFGWPFALVFFISSIILGLSGGLAAGVFEARRWLSDQARFKSPESKPAPKFESCACSSSPSLAFATANTSTDFYYQCQPIPADRGYSSSEPVLKLEIQRRPAPQPCAESGGCDSTLPKPAAAKITTRQFVEEVWNTGKRLLIMFLGFAFIGYFLNGLIPASWVASLFGSGNIYSVPLAATLGLPLYINSEASLPLVRSLIDGGMSQGAAMAFLITGAGTSIGAVAGAITIARWKVIGLIVGTLWVGAIVMGFLFNFLLSTGAL